MNPFLKKGISVITEAVPRLRTIEYRLIGGPSARINTFLPDLLSTWHYMYSILFELRIPDKVTVLAALVVIIMTSITRERQNLDGLRRRTCLSGYFQVRRSVIGMHAD